MRATSQCSGPLESETEVIIMSANGPLYNFPSKTFFGPLTLLTVRYCSEFMVEFGWGPQIIRNVHFYLFHCKVGNRRDVKGALSVGKVTVFSFATPQFSSLEVKRKRKNWLLPYLFKSFPMAFSLNDVCMSYYLPPSVRKAQLTS